MKNQILPIGFVLFLLMIWEAVVRLAHIEKFIMPGPSDVLQALVKEMTILGPHSLTTLYESVMGLVVAIVVALGLAILMDLLPLVKKAIYPVLIISQTVPTIALAPLLIIWFGFGSLPKIIVVVVTCFFPIVISLVQGLEHVDLDLINHFQLMGASKFQRFIHLKLPFGLINFFSGLKIAATYSVMGAVIGEWLGGNQGLGVYMTRARSAYAIDKMFAAIVVIMVLSMGLVFLVSLLEKVFMPWKRLDDMKEGIR